MESLPQVGGRFDAYGKSEISRRFESYKIVYVLILWEFRLEAKTATFVLKLTFRNY